MTGGCDAHSSEAELLFAPEAFNFSKNQSKTLIPKIFF